MGKGNMMGGENLIQLLKRQLLRGNFSGAIAILSCGMMLIIIGYYFENIDKNPEEAVRVGGLFVGCYLLIKAFEIVTSSQNVVNLAIKKHFNLGEPLQNASQTSIAKGIDALTDDFGPIKDIKMEREIKEGQKSIAQALADLEKEKEKLIAESTTKK